MTEYPRFVGTICFPQNPGFKARDLDAIVVGWGRDEEDTFGEDLRQANVTILSARQCERRLPKYDGFKDDLYCVDDDSGNEGGVCKGDSGGPLFHLNPKTRRYEVLGIVQGGKACGTEFLPNVFVDVNSPNIRSWIWGEIHIVYTFDEILSLN